MYFLNLIFNFHLQLHFTCLLGIFISSMNCLVIAYYYFCIVWFIFLSDFLKAVYLTFKCMMQIHRFLCVFFRMVFLN